MKQHLYGSVCNLCDSPGCFEDSLDVAQIPGCMRKFQHEQFTVWRCNHCSSLHCLADDLDLDRYYAHYLPHQQTMDFYARCHLQNLLRILRRIGMTKDSKILDYGCSNGTVIRYLEQNGFPHVVGYDPYVDEFASESVLAERYDCVLMLTVIEHVEDPRAVFKEVLECVDTNGLYVIATPRAEKIELVADAMELPQPYHLHIPSEKALLNMGEQAGLDTIMFMRRHWKDTLYPTVNMRFVAEYYRRVGGVIDGLCEPPRWRALMSPRLWWYMFAGYLFPTGSNMVVAFRNHD